MFSEALRLARVAGYDQLTLTCMLSPCPSSLVGNSGLTTTMVNGQLSLMSFEAKYQSTTSNPFATDTTFKFQRKAALCLSQPTLSASPVSVTPTTGGQTIPPADLKIVPPSQPVVSSTSSPGVEAQQLIDAAISRAKLSAPPGKPPLRRTQSYGPRYGRELPRPPAKVSTTTGNLPPPGPRCRMCGLTNGFHKHGCPRQAMDVAP